MAWVVRNLISTQVYAPAPAGPTSSLELRAARGRLAEDSAFILTNRSHPTALRRASVTERALYFTAAVQAVGASERDGAGAAGVAGRVHGFGATGGDTDFYGRLRVRLEAWTACELLRGADAVPESCDLGVPLCRGAFTSLIRLVSIS